MADLSLLTPATGQTPTLSNHLVTKDYADTTRGDAGINARTANYTLALADRGGVVEVNSASSATVTVPTNASVAFPVGTVIRVRKTGAGNVSVVGASGVTISWAGSFTVTTQYTIAEIHKRGADSWAGMLIDSSAAVGESATYTGTKTINGKFGVNVTPSVKQPVNMVTTHAGGSMTGSQDKVAFALGANVTGNFSADTGSNPGFFWGLNLFATTGTSAGDGAGLTDIIGGLIEMSIQTPAGTTLPHVIGLQAEAAFFGASSGATVTQMESMRVSAPKRKDGASTGTATNVYCLFIEDPSAYNVGSSNSKFALFVEGGISRIQGRVDIADTLVSYSSSLNLQGDYSGTGKIQLTTNNIGFFGVTPVARQTLPASGSVTAANIRTALINLGLCV